MDRNSNIGRCLKFYYTVMGVFGGIVPNDSTTVVLGPFLDLDVFSRCLLDWWTTR